MADEIIEIADDGSNDWMEREGKAAPNGEMVNRSRLRVDTRKWLMSKMAPKKYGDKMSTELTANVQVDQRVLTVNHFDLNEIQQLETLLLKAREGIDDSGSSDQ